MLCEGMRVNAVCRISGASKMTVLKLVTDVGQACADYMNHNNIHSLQSKRVECDEIWSFYYSKARLQNRRFTRLTNAFSKKIDKHVHSFNICMMNYNFCKQHRTLYGSTLAMAADITDHIWDFEELIDLLKQKELPKKRGKYKMCDTTT